MNDSLFPLELQHQIRQGHAISLEEIHEQKLKELLSFSFVFDYLSKAEEIFFDNRQGLSLKLKSSMERPFISLPYSLKDLKLALEYLSLTWSQTWNYTNPMVSFKIKMEQFDIRVTLIHESCFSDLYPRAYFRVHSPSLFQLPDFFCDEVNSYQLENDLLKWIHDKDNVLVAGSTGSGKTSFLNSVIHQFSPSEHYLIIEDTAELQSSHAHTSPMLATGEKQKKMVDYLKYAMRMSPDRLIVGELRSEEVISYLLALNTGHGGCWSTIHANSALDAIDRLCTIYNVYATRAMETKFVKSLIASSINKIIFLENKRITEVIRLIGFNQEEMIYEKVL
jgi:type IV secretion system protein VirB11